MRAELTERQQRIYTTMTQMGAKGSLGRWVTAQEIAERAGIEAARRNGHQARASWSGHMAEALGATSPLRGLVKRGLVEKCLDPSVANRRLVYRLTR